MRKYKSQAYSLIILDGFQDDHLTPTAGDGDVNGYGHGKVRKCFARFAQDFTPKRLMRWVEEISHRILRGTRRAKGGVGGSGETLTQV